MYLTFIIKAFLIAFFTLGLLLNFNLSSWEYKKTLYYKEKVEFNTKINLQAARYINKNLKDTKIFIVSDPATTTIIESITRTSSNGGMYTSKENRVSIWKFLNGNLDINSFKESQSAISDSNNIVLLIYDMRTKLWAQENEEFIVGYANLIWKPFYNEDLNCTEVKFQYTSLELSDKGLCIYKI